MNTESALDLNRENLKAEIETLRRSLLPFFIGALPVVGWIYYLRVIIGVWDLSWNSVPVVALSLSAYASFRLREKHYDAACWLTVASLVISYIGLIMAHPHSLVIAYGVVAILSAHALLGAWPALGVLLVNTLSLVALQRYSPQLAATGSVLIVESVILSVLLVAIASVQAHPLNTAVEWALASWEQTREALIEVRSRRGELYRVVKALDESTYRVQRMNNELIVARREAEVARAIKARFAATVSHELRAPLNLILGFSAMMVQTPERYTATLPEEFREDVETIYRNSQHLSALVDDVLDLSQIEAEQLPLVKDQTDLTSEVIERVVSTVGPMAERKGLYLRVQSQPDLPWVLVDAVRMRQVLINLLNNAVRFTARGGITVSIKLDGDRLLVSVQDTGLGISSEELPRLFQEFHQLHLSQDRDEGSGLGLSISKHLIELHGGSIWAESKVGQGSTFYFTVPLPGTSPLQDPALDSQQRQPTTPIAGTNTCLVVSSYPNVIRSIGRFLGEYRTVGVGDEQEARRAIQILHPRAILANSQCAQSLSAWLEDMPYDVPIIGCLDDGATPQQQSVLGHLIKPISEEMLRLAIAHLEEHDAARVLVVDDDPAAVRLLERMLTALPRRYALYHAYDGVQALELARQIEPHLVFVDLMMPGLSGEQVIAQMREDERLAGTQVIVVSAVDRSDHTLVLNKRLMIYTKRGLNIHTAGEGIKALVAGITPQYLPDSAERGLPQPTHPH